MINPINLEGKVALVTGASSGIGRATALTLAAHGAAVTINHRWGSQAVSEQLLQEITAAGGRGLLACADVTQRNEVLDMVHKAVQELGPIDVLVNNAGALIKRQKFMDITPESWDEVLNLNLKSVLHCCQAVIPSMIERRSGSIVNVTSIAAHTGGGPGAIPYATAKGGLSTLTRGLAKEMAPYGIRINAVSPGLIDTPFHERFSTPEMMKGFVASIPMGRAGTPAEIANIILMLASEAGSYLTGETIEVNGGQLML